MMASYSLAEYKAELKGFCYFLYIKSPNTTFLKKGRLPQEIHFWCSSKKQFRTAAKRII